MTLGVYVSGKINTHRKVYPQKPRYWNMGKVELINEVVTVNSLYLTLIYPGPILQIHPHLLIFFQPLKYLLHLLVPIRTQAHACTNE